MKFKDLLETAKSELKDLSTVENPDFRLEQAVYNKEKDIWEVVVSYLVPNTNLKQIPIVEDSYALKFDRIYKKLEIDKRKTVLGLYIFDNG
ncbi:MAG: hypothetical protein LAT75_15150 [Candidatus Cyclonatronum sp.]|uniref:hypothetical protein n=1 Tax=Cyclonatronum sp. TaxID=3024185 RepID=UPI0025BF1AFC|nr:hypothetical protein [Cyclonatronum sp.]MCH8488199.1 hypothetical protein [Cyclonatronum sp.]